MLVILPLVVVSVAAILVAGYRTHRRGERRVREWRRFQACLSELSAAFLALPSTAAEAVMRRAMRRVLECLDFDRVTLYQASDPSRPRWFTVRHSEVADLPRLEPEAEPWNAGEVSSLAERVMTGQVVTFDTSNRHEWSVLPLSLLPTGTVCAIVVPLRAGQVTIGVLWCVQVRADGPLDEDRTAKVRLIGDLLASALRQCRIEEQLDDTHQLNSAVFQSLSQQVAVLDREGAIIAVNDAWLQFGHANGLSSVASIAPGANYLDAARRGAEAGAPAAAEAFEGLRAVCEGRRQLFSLEYDCSSPSEHRWFLMTAAALRRKRGGAVITHRDISLRKLAEDDLRDLSGRLIHAQEDAQRRMARELHDGVNQMVALLAIDIEQMALAPAPTAKAVATWARALLKRTTELSGEIHRLSHHLHPARLEVFGLVAAIEGYCAELSAQQQLAVAFSHERVPASIPPDTALCLFRIVQESLRNVTSHSGATEAAVQLVGEGASLHLTVRDAGAGFDPASVGRTGGLGLVSMRERVHYAGGDLVIVSRPSEGTRIDVRLPLGGTREPVSGRAAAAVA